MVNTNEELSKEKLDKLINLAERISDLVPEDEEMCDDKGEISAERIIAILERKYGLGDRTFKDLLLIKISSLVQEHNIQTIQKISDLYDQLSDLYKKYNEEVPNPYYNKLAEITEKYTTPMSKVNRYLYERLSMSVGVLHRNLPFGKKLFDYFYNKDSENRNKINEEVKPYYEAAIAKGKDGSYAADARNIERQISQIVSSNNNGEYIAEPILKLFETRPAHELNFLGQHKESHYAILALNLSYFYPSGLIEGDRLGKADQSSFTGSFNSKFNRRNLDLCFQLNQQYKEKAGSISQGLYDKISRITGKPITSLTLDNLDQIKDIIEAEKVLHILKETPGLLADLNNQLSTILQYDGTNFVGDGQPSAIGENEKKQFQ
jgi:hypothetical protein